MKTRVFYFIAARIILLFTIATMATFLPDYLREFFGDVKYPIDDIPNWGNNMDYEWQWGALHYWYFFMMMSLFILAVVDAFLSARSVVLKNYDNVIF